MLISSGDILLKSKNDTTIAHYAAQNNHGAIILQLVELYRIYKPLVELCVLNVLDDEDRLESIIDENPHATHFTIEQLKQLEVVISNIKMGIESGLLNPTLVKNSSDFSIVNSPTKSGLCPLHLAAGNDCSDVIDAFIKLFSPFKTNATMETNQYDHVNPLDHAGETPLHKAGRNKHIIIYRKLVEVGASDSIVSMLKQTPRQLLMDDIIL